MTIIGEVTSESVLGQSEAPRHSCGREGFNHTGAARPVMMLRVVKALHREI